MISPLPRKCHWRPSVAVTWRLRLATEYPHNSSLGNRILAKEDESPFPWNSRNYWTGYRWFVKYALLGYLAEHNHYHYSALNSQPKSTDRFLYPCVTCCNTKNVGRIPFLSAPKNRPEKFMNLLSSEHSQANGQVRIYGKLIGSLEKIGGIWQQCFISSFLFKFVIVVENTLGNPQDGDEERRLLRRTRHWSTEASAEIAVATDGSNHFWLHSWSMSNGRSASKSLGPTTCGGEKRPALMNLKKLEWQNRMRYNYVRRGNAIIILQS